MSQTEYQNQQELETEVRDHCQEVETLGEKQTEHQEDLENLQEKLRMLKNSRGVFAQSDRQLTNSVEIAIEARETNIEECKNEMNTVKVNLENKLNNLNKSLNKARERVSKMEEVVDSLNYKQERVINNINFEINQQKEDIEDANLKGDAIKKLIDIATLVVVSGSAASTISGMMSGLQSLGLFR